MARRPMVGRYDQNQSDYANHESKLYFWSHYELNPLIYWWLGTDCDDYEDLLFWDCGHCCCSWWWWDKWDNTLHCISLSVNGRWLHQEILTSRSITFIILGHWAISTSRSITFIIIGHWEILTSISISFIIF